MFPLTAIPVPPAAYWVNIPWWGYFGIILFAIIILSVIGPWAVQRVRQQPSAMLSREEALVARENKLLNQRDEYVDDMRSERERLVAKIKVLEEDRDRGWNLGRGMEVTAKGLWHEANYARNKFNAVVLTLQKLVDGEMSMSAAKELSNQNEFLEALPALETLANTKEKLAPFTKNTPTNSDY